MRPWTTRTLQAAVVAAGLAAAGTGTASAAQLPELTEPDLSPVPDEIGFTAPVDACSAQDAPGFNAAKAPCVDAQLKVSTPNVVKQVGAEVVRTSHGVAGELADGQPLSTAKLTRVSQHVGEAKNGLLGLTETRPTVGVSAQPRHMDGLLTPHSPQASLLDAQIGPRGENHEGVSGVDTALSMTAAQGYTVGPLATPGAALKPVLRGDERSGQAQLDLPEPSEIVPGARPVTSLTHADELSNVPETVLGRVAGEAGSGLRQGAGQAGGQLRDGVGEVREGVRPATDRLGTVQRGAERGVHGVTRTGKHSVDHLGTTAKHATEFLGGVAQGAGRALPHTAQQAGAGLQTTVDKLPETAQGTADTLGEVVRDPFGAVQVHHP